MDKLPSSSDTSVVHFVRDPADMVVSGYLYHLDGQEREWTNAHFKVPSVKTKKRFGSFERFSDMLAALGETPSGWNAANTTYQRLLQKNVAHPDRSLLAEAIRTTSAEDGVLHMLQDRRRLQQQFNGSVMEVCLGSLAQGTTSHNDSWARIAAFAALDQLLLSPSWEEEHRTNAAASERDTLVALARDALLRVLPAEYGPSTWPCGGQAALFGY